MANNETDRSAKLNIDILLEEYRTLRTEIIARTTAGFQIWGVVAIMLTWIFSHLFDGTFSWVRCAFLVMVAAILAAVFWRIWRIFQRDINKCARRIREIEAEVNFYAGRTLLRWESHWGAAITGWFGPSEPKPYSPGDEPPQWSPRLPEDQPTV